MNSEIQDKGGAQEAGRSSLHEVLACTSDAEIGARWRQNSSLEEWFPFTAQKLKTLEAELGNAAVIAVKLGQLSKHWREASADYRQRAREWATGDPMHEQRSACADMLENCANVLDATVQANK